jgi:hypothetical protein
MKISNILFRSLSATYNEVYLYKTTFGYKTDLQQNMSNVFFQSNETGY